ncbi:hypothetical protein V1478_006616 [Vespula squamosa]|uniref:Uncharacterized protein n=1 Tax=Vespula squamosa TaxID=30214 RepID=A0ABD2B8E6_VESSQ
MCKLKYFECFLRNVYSKTLHFTHHDVAEQKRKILQWWYCLKTEIEQFGNIIIIVDKKKIN